jgi:hypothetical protein
VTVLLSFLLPPVLSNRELAFLLLRFESAAQSSFFP